MQSIDLSRPRSLAGVVDYQTGAIVSRALLNTPKGSSTVFAFDAGQRLSEHTVPVSALMLVIEGRATVTIGGNRHSVSAGEAVQLPADVGHAVSAEERFKMLLTLIRAE